MQVKKIVLALAVTFVAPSAFAADLSTGVPTENIIYVAGATAQTGGLALSVARLCGQGNTLLTLSQSGALTGKGWKCNTASGTTYTNLPGVTGPFVVLKNEGGSLNGINPMRDGSTQSQLDITNCTVTGTNAVCPAGLVAKPVHVGFSDLSEKIFSAKNQLATQSAGNTYTADISLGQQQGFGVIASAELYAKMAADQGVATPSISRSQMASLMTQTVSPWGILLPKTAAGSLPTTDLTLLRRSTSSGTQAAAELFFLNNPCAKGSVGGSATATVGSSAGQDFGDLIVKQASSSDTVLSGAASGYAIGVVSLENAQPASGWKYLAIDGVHPGAANSPDYQKKNILNGSYQFVYEPVMFMNTKSTLGASTLANIVRFKDGFVQDLGVGENLATSNGLVGDPTAASADFGANTSGYSRSGNECAPLGYAL